MMPNLALAEIRALRADNEAQQDLHFHVPGSLDCLSFHAPKCVNRK